ncbi:tat (twin-arginine translocation) pathway signal sequence [Polaromonas sp.]|uniref:tat (twin-arginine translocation) pathway signal sequence n=1 Tax=Polaromonas sp. TaxID=1869339 RepID=UPI0025D53CBA|nr:tat (twin-arginine translocation) pathway signal sequence [Polaromonas sp.]
MKVIPITSLSHSVADSCGEDSGEVPKLKLPLTRRSLLRGSGLLLGTLAAGGVLSALAPSRAWAVELKTLSSAEGTTLMKMGRVLYPHAKLPDAVYALLAKDLDAGATSDAKTTTLLRGGIADLDKAAGGNFTKATPAKQLAAVKSLESTPFFAAVRGKCVTSLYDNDMAFTALGYPGSSWEKGGYITRGFQDLKWLPEPSKDASPAAWMG